jgi:hypothetical protein
VEQVAGYDHRLGSRRDDPIDGRPEGTGDIGFPLIDTGRGLTMILPDAEMRIGDVGEFHRWRMKRNNLKIKQLHRHAKPYAWFPGSNAPMVFTWAPILLLAPASGISAPTGWRQIFEEERVREDGWLIPRRSRQPV